MLRLLLGLLASITLAAPVAARDIPRANPMRQTILDAAREDTKEFGEYRFIVKDLFQAGDYAYLCALLSDKAGHILGTDDQLDVHQWLLIRHDGQWLHLEKTGRFAVSQNKVDCSTPELATADDADNGDMPRTEKDLKALWLAQFRLDYFFEQDEGREYKVPPALASALKQHGILTDFSIEQGKRDIPSFKQDDQRKSCKDTACRHSVDATWASLRQQQTNARISALVWNNCTRLSLQSNAEAINQCLHANMSKKYCRPQMMAFADHADIAQCVSELNQTSKKLGVQPF